MFGADVYHAVQGSNMEENDKVIKFARDKFDNIARKIRDACIEVPEVAK